MELGLIYQSCKTVSPTKTIKFCGFIYDTQNIPTIIFPENRVSRSIAMIDYIGQGCSHILRRLVVNTVVGILQSLVPSTPRNIGASFLRPLCEDLHRIQENDSPEILLLYNDTTSAKLGLSVVVERNFDLQALEVDSAQRYSHYSDVLGRW